MARYLSEEFCDLLKGDINLGIFFRLGTDPPLRITAGVNDMPIGISSVDEAGAVYRGAGRLASLPDLETMINGLADEVEITISGVLSSHLALIAENAPSVIGKELLIGFAPLSDDWQPLTAITPIWRGFGDLWGYTRTAPRAAEQSGTQTITLHAQAGTPARSKQHLLTYSDQSQRAVNPVSGVPEDQFCERVARYSPGHIVSWPRF